MKNKNRNNKTNTSWDIEKTFKEYGNIKELSGLINAIKTSYDRIKREGQEDIYYIISKNMNNADIINVVNLYDKRKSRKATMSDIDYERFPCYQALGTPININNEVPIMFQSKECWSDFRYGTIYNEKEGEYKEKDKVLYKGKLYKDTGYNYGTFHESSCACCSTAMVISFERGETITPVDIRNMWEENTYTYREKGKSTSHAAIDKAREKFALRNLAERDSSTNNKIKYSSSDGSFKISQDDGYILVDYLLAGHPIIARCDGAGIFTDGGGHFLVIAGVNEDDVKTYKKEDGTIDKADYGKIRIYVSDPAEYHKNSKTEYYLSTFTNVKNTEKFWVFDGTNKSSYKFSTSKFDYNNNIYSEWFDPQDKEKTETKTLPNGTTKKEKQTIVIPYAEYKMKNKAWENPK